MALTLADSSSLGCTVATSAGPTVSFSRSIRVDSSYRRGARPGSLVVGDVWFFNIRRNPE